MTRYIVAALAALAAVGGYLASGALRGGLWLVAAALVLAVMVLGEGEADAGANRPLRALRDLGQHIGERGSSCGEPDDVVLGDARVRQQVLDHRGVGVAQQSIEQVGHGRQVAFAHHARPAIERAHDDETVGRSQKEGCQPPRAMDGMAGKRDARPFIEKGRLHFAQFSPTVGPAPATQEMGDKRLAISQIIIRFQIIVPTRGMDASQGLGNLIDLARHPIDGGVMGGDVIENNPALLPIEIDVMASWDSRAGRIAIQTIEARLRGIGSLGDKGDGVRCAG